MDRKMSTSTEQLCKGYATEFRSYFEYCRSLRFEDRPDYAYLKRLFKELFYRKGFQYDNMFDWTVLNLQQERSRAPPERPLLSNQQVTGTGGAGGDATNQKTSENQDGARARDSYNQEGGRDAAEVDQRKAPPGTGAELAEKERSRSGGDAYQSHDQRSASRSGYGAGAAAPATGVKQQLSGNGGSQQNPSAHGSQGGR
jgi:hypothetical protein